MARKDAGGGGGGQNGTFKSKTVIQGKNQKAPDIASVLKQGGGGGGSCSGKQGGAGGKSAQGRQAAG